MDAGLIKTNFSKKQAAFLICLCHWRHLELTEQCEAAPQLLLIATALGALADHYWKQVYPTLQLTQLWHKT